MSAKRPVKLILKVGESCHTSAPGAPKMTNTVHVMFYRWGEGIPVDFYLKVQLVTEIISGY